jgi:hypothetical protein
MMNRVLLLVARLINHETDHGEHRDLKQEEHQKVKRRIARFFNDEK